jgi:ABC-type branched-subunit amino acid transport system ATPase component
MSVVGLSAQSIPRPVVPLETIGLEKRFGGIVATSNVSLKVEVGARHALIGPNGAGKTTLINQLTGVLAPTAGRVLLGGEDITTLSAEARVRRGLARTFQINQLFLPMTPLEALAIAVNEQHNIGAQIWSSFGSHQAVQTDIADLVDRFGLGDVLTQRISTLPYGRQRLLEIALAFAAKPRVLLLDEPAAGVPESERGDILAAVASLPREVAVLLIEHDMDLVFRFAERVTVLVGGAVFKDGPAKAIADDPDVRAVYLGGGLHG